MSESNENIVEAEALEEAGILEADVGAYLLVLFSYMYFFLIYLLKV